MIEMDTWSTMEAGVQQRVKVLEMFLADVYDAGRIFDDGDIPRDVITTSSHYHRASAGATCERRPHPRVGHRPDPRQPR